MNKIIVVLFALLTLFTGCDSEKKENSSKSAETAQDAETTASNDQKKSKPPSILVMPITDSTRIYDLLTEVDSVCENSADLQYYRSNNFDSTYHPYELSQYLSTTKIEYKMDPDYPGEISSSLKHEPMHLPSSVSRIMVAGQPGESGNERVEVVQHVSLHYAVRVKDRYLGSVPLLHLKPEELQKVGLLEKFK